MPDDKLDTVADTLKADGWVVSTGPLPIHYSFWQSGWEEIAAVSRRLFPPPSLPNRELLILPTSFVGLDKTFSDSLSNSDAFIRLEDNLYYPQSHILLETIIWPILQGGRSSASVLFDAWASYFVDYLASLNSPWMGKIANQRSRDIGKTGCFYDFPQVKLKYILVIDIEEDCGHCHSDCKESLKEAFLR